MDSLEREGLVYEPKLDKVYSEKWKNKPDLYEKIGRESFQLKRLASDFDSNPQISNKTQSELKTYNIKR